jgi:hypothetical protein
LLDAVAGTPLTFQLFTDASCTTPVATQVVNVESVSLVEQIKPLKVSGAPAAPKPAEVRHVMTGVTPVGGACQLQLATIGGTEPPPPAVCAPDSVRAGAPCVDKYEASVWDIPAGNTTLIQKVNDGTATPADLTGGGATQIGATLGPPAFTCSPAYPPSFPDNGNYSAPLYAASVPGVLPSACITAFQAQVACELSGKRLLTNAEWVAAATGTPDTDTDNGTTDCNTNAPGAGVNAPVNTGSRSGCVSMAGISDAIGNVYEWTTGGFSTTWVRGGYWGDGVIASVSLAPRPARTARSTPSASGVAGSRAAGAPQSSGV